MINFKFLSIILMFLSIAFLMELAFPYHATAQNDLNAKANINLTKTYNAFNETSLLQARDAETRNNDKRLTNNCIESGYNKTECLCLTRIFKYELSLTDYKTMSIIFDQNSMSKMQARLLNEYSPAKLNTLKTLSETLLHSTNFKSRCANAKTYYSAEDDN